MPNLEQHVFTRKTLCVPSCIHVRRPFLAANLRVLPGGKPATLPLPTRLPKGLEVVQVAGCHCHLVSICSPACPERGPSQLTCAPGGQTTLPLPSWAQHLADCLAHPGCLHVVLTLSSEEYWSGTPDCPSFYLGGWMLSCVLWGVSLGKWHKGEGSSCDTWGTLSACLAAANLDPSPPLPFGSRSLSQPILKGREL